MLGLTLWPGLWRMGLSPPPLLLGIGVGVLLMGPLLLLLPPVPFEVEVTICGWPL
jgi:hypothetical protein